MEAEVVFLLILMATCYRTARIAINHQAVIYLDAKLPEKLAEYRIIRELGRGGMGVVYEAIQETLQRRVALKVLPAPNLPDARSIQRFQREARAAAGLRHTNIVPIFDVGEVEGLHYYAMQGVLHRDIKPPI